MVNFGQKTAILRFWYFAQKKKKPPKLPKYNLKPLLVSKKLPAKKLKPLLVSQKLPKFKFCTWNPYKSSEVTNFRIWNFNDELFEINFNFWKVGKYWNFGDLSANFHQKLVARSIFFIGKSSKTAFFSFREITIVERRKIEKFQKKPNSPR